MIFVIKIPLVIWLKLIKIKKMKVLPSEINLIKLTNFLDYLTANGTFFFI